MKFGGKFIAQVGSILGDVWENVTAIMDRLYFGGNSVIPAWESVKNFFKNLWKDVAPSWKSFFDWIKGPLESFFKPSLEMLDKLKGWLPEFGAGRTLAVSGQKLPDMGKLRQDVTRNQNNNFSITINTAKNDNPEVIADKVMN